jgi:hypothetical protein
MKEMALLKIYLDTTELPVNKSYPLVISVSHQGEEEILSTPYYLPARNFDSLVERAVAIFKSGFPKKKVAEINMYLNRETTLLESIINDLATEQVHYSLSQILSTYRSKGDCGILKNYVNNLLKNHCRYENELEKYYDLMDIIFLYKEENYLLRLDEIDKSWLSDFRLYLFSSNYPARNIRSYIRLLHRVCVYAREDGLYNVTPDPFRARQSGILPTIDSAPSVAICSMNDKILERISMADLSACPELDFCRDLFLFSYHTNGMLFREMASLKNSNIHSGLISYRKHHRSFEMISIKITPVLQRLIDKYYGREDNLFPIYDISSVDLHDQYSIRFRRYKIHLRELSSFLGISCSLVQALSERRALNRKLKVSISLGEKEKRISLSCSLNGDIRSQLLCVLDELLGNGALAV